MFCLEVLVKLLRSDVILRSNTTHQFIDGLPGGVFQFHKTFFQVTYWVLYQKFWCLFDNLFYLFDFFRDKLTIDILFILFHRHGSCQGNIVTSSWHPCVTTIGSSIRRIFTNITTISHTSQGSCHSLDVGSGSHGVRNLYITFLFFFLFLGVDVTTININGNFSQLRTLIPFLGFGFLCVTVAFCLNFYITNTRTHVTDTQVQFGLTNVISTLIEDRIYTICNHFALIRLVHWYDSFLCYI